jgi:NAD+ kinase
MSIEQRKREYADEMQRRERDRFFWAPPGGESMGTLCPRIDRVLNTLHRDGADLRVLMVCHGEVMWAFRVRLERMSQQQYQKLDYSADPRDKIHNAQILHYTRREPGTGLIAPYLNWVWSVCPWDATHSRNEWEEIRRPKYANEELLAVVEQTPRLISGSER